VTVADETTPEASDEAREETHESAPEPELLHDCPVAWSHGQKVLHVPAGAYLKVLASLHTEGFLTCIDLCAVDYLTYELPRELPDGIEPQRFEVVVSLLAHQGARRLRVRVQVDATAPNLPTLFSMYPGTEAMEREAFDMFGIVFDGHPDPNRILLPEDWVGHPLRKDYNSGRIPVQFKATTDAR